VAGPVKPNKLRQAAEHLLRSLFFSAFLEADLTALDGDGILLLISK